MKKAIGGNSGYVGYSESVRSVEAKSKGKFPKTLFKKEYGLTENKFQELLKRGVIYASEWHHTSKFGNKTEFYDIDNKILFNILKGDKKAALEAYKKTKDYTVPVKKNIKKNEYVGTVILRKGEDADYLLSIGCKYSLTKRNNYSFSYNQSLLKNTRFRKIFKIGYSSKDKI